MTRYLVLCCVLTMIAGTSVRGATSERPEIAAYLVQAGLALDDPNASPDGAKPDDGKPDDTKPVDAGADDNKPADTTPDPSKSCAGVSFSRNLRYGESDLNLLDVATGDSRDSSPRPVLVFVAGESFADDNAAGGGDPLQDAAMCFAARNGMVGVKVNYRLAPAYPWPAGAKDVAAATSWVHQNIDLFGGSRDEIVAVGYSVGAFHVASLLAHPELKVSDSGIAAAVLVSGIYRASADADAAEKSYFGSDAGQYDARSAFPGILNIETPLLLAWSALDPPRRVEAAETLKRMLCNSATHCPHTTVLENRETLASAFVPDPSGGGLAQPTLELVREIEERGLP